MKFKEFIFLFVSSLNPFNYRNIVIGKKRKAVTYFLFLLSFAVIINVFLNAPGIKNTDSFNEEISKFEYFNITGIDIRLREPVTLLEKPKIVLNFNNQTNMTDERILITKTDVYWKKLDLLSFHLFKTEKEDIRQYSDIVANFNRIKGLYWIVFVLLLPSLIFMMMTLNIVKYVFLTLVLFPFSMLFLKILKKKTTLFRIFKTILFSYTYLIIMDFIVTPIIDIGFFRFIIYVIVLVLALLKVSSKTKNEQDEKR